MGGKKTYPFSFLLYLLLGKLTTEETTNEGNLRQTMIIFQRALAIPIGNVIVDIWLELILDCL